MGIFDTSTTAPAPTISPLGAPGSTTQSPIAITGPAPGPQSPTAFSLPPQSVTVAPPPVDPFAPPAGQVVAGQATQATPPPFLTPQPPAASAPVVTAPGVSLTPALMSNEVNQVIDPNSPLFQRAAAVANEESNAKGLLNSSMAVGASENALLAAALPIAEQNVQAKNTMTTTQAGINQQTSMANMAAQNTEIMAGLDQTNKLQLAGVNAKYQTFLNTDQNAASLYNSTLQSISQIQNNPNMDANTKSYAIQQAITALHGGMNMLSNISGLNINFSFQ